MLNVLAAQYRYILALITCERAALIMTPIRLESSFACLCCNLSEREGLFSVLLSSRTVLEAIGARSRRPCSNIAVGSFPET